MRTLAVLTTLSMLLVGSAPSAGLERRPVSLEDDGAWSTGGTCTVTYYNNCTGWVWVWSDWPPYHRIGVVFAGCTDAGCVVTESATYFHEASAAGRGYTGVLGLWSVDANDCPTGASISSTPFLPYTGWNPRPWPDVPVPPRFAVLYETGAAFSWPGWPGRNTYVVSDHPSAGPSGPPACGSCFPAPRTSHSYDWGPRDSPLCPGSPLWDGTCDAELLFAVRMSCTLGLEDASWGRLKQLYR